MENEDNLKEINEMLEGVRMLLLTCARVVRDGKMDLQDIVYLTQLIGNLGVIVEAIKGIDKIPSDIKEMSSIEAMRVGRKIYDIVDEVKKEFKRIERRKKAIQRI